MSTTPATRTRRPLAISWSGLLSLVYSGKVSRDDLTDALFYFGCSREHVFENGVGGEEGEMQFYYDEDPAGATAVYQMLLEVIQAAEAEDRIVWRDRHGHNSFAQLNEFLARHGLPAILPTDRFADYCYPEVHDIVKEQDLPYDIISNHRHFA